MAIRISDKDVKRLASLNKKAYRKDYRLRSQFGVDVAPATNKKATDFTNRKELNAHIKKLESFTNRNKHRYVKVKSDYTNEEVVFTRESVNKYKSAVGAYNKEVTKRQKALAKLDFMIGRQATGESADSRRRMGDVRYEKLTLKKANLSGFSSQQGLDMVTKQTLKRSKDETLEKKQKQLFKNYKTAVKNVFGETSKGRKMIKKLNTIGVDKFMLGYYTNFFGDLSYLYSFKEIEERYNSIMESLDMMLDKDYEKEINKRLNTLNKAY